MRRKLSIPIITSLLGSLIILGILPVEVKAIGYAFNGGNPGTIRGYIDCKSRSGTVLVMGHDICKGHDNQICQISIQGYGYYRTNGFGKASILVWKYLGRDVADGQLRERITLKGNCLTFQTDGPVVFGEEPK